MFQSPTILVIGIASNICFFSILAYFKHPKLVCNPIAVHHIHPGKGLYIQMGPNPVTTSISIPLESKDLGPMWVQGTCVPRMGKSIQFFLKIKLGQIFMGKDAIGNNLIKTEGIYLLRNNKIC